MSGVGVGYECSECGDAGEKVFHGMMRDDDGHDHDGILECLGCGLMYVEEIFTRPDSGGS